MTRPPVRACLALGLACLWLASAARAATPQQVDKAIKRGVEFLYARQNDKANWESTPGPDRDARKEPSDPRNGQWGGYSALATYALLDAGEPWHDKRVRDAVEWLNKAPMIGTYAVALRAQVWQYLPLNSGVRNAAQRDAGMLLSGMKAKGDARGMWHYFVSDPNSPRYDHSTSQIALLGVWACSQAGREAPYAFWKEAENAWRSHQNEDGGWSYIYKGNGEHGQTKMSMTLAGIATLFIAQDYVHQNDGLACKGNVFDDRLVKATKWVVDHIGDGVSGGYNLYAMERVGIASGFKYFGAFDWYKNGADRLVRGQGADGSWGNGSIPETAFALIFLSRGRAPVVLNKFEYHLERPSTGPRPAGGVAAAAAAAALGGKPAAGETFAANWSQRPRDVALFTRWMSGVTERKLNWQVVSDRLPVDEWHDAPVLYMAGNQPLNLPADTADKLRQYIEEGGLLFGHPDCGSKEFLDSFVALGKRLFPAYEFRELPADHPIYTRQQYLRKTWKNPPSVLGLSNGVRELMVVMPNSDPARYWQQMAYNGKEELFQAMNGIVLYAVDRQNLKYKGGTHVVRLAADGVAAAPDASTARPVKVARLEFPGNWNPEPGGWRRLTAILQTRNEAALSTQPVKLGDGKLSAVATPVAHLTGTGTYAFTREQLADLKRFVADKGVLICDAAGGDSAFARSMEEQLAQLVPGSKFEPIPADDTALAAKPAAGAADAPLLAPPPIFQPAVPEQNARAATQPVGRSVLPELPSTATTTPATTQSAPDAAAPPGAFLPGKFPVEYRAYARQRLGAAQTLRLKGLKSANKWSVIFSPEDLSTGLVGHPVDGVNGYTPATATEITRRLILNLAPAPPAAPK